MENPSPNPSFLEVEIDTINEVKKWTPLIEILAVVILVCGIVGLFFALIR